LAQLEFLGDDDLWVFINNRLVLDVGGVHVPSGGTVTIFATAGLVETEVWESDFGDVISVSENTYTLSDFDLEPGGSYSVSIFHAERQKEGSSFRLRLTGFDESNVECE
jgi:fibro-slime domain-containing protein